MNVSNIFGEDLYKAMQEYSTGTADDRASAFRKLSRLILDLERVCRAITD